MLDTVRKDRFHLNIEDLKQEEYVILRKKPFTTSNKFLNQILVTDDSSEKSSE